MTHDGCDRSIVPGCLCHRYRLYTIQMCQLPFVWKVVTVTLDGCDRGIVPGRLYHHSVIVSVQLCQLYYGVGFATKHQRGVRSTLTLSTSTLSTASAIFVAPSEPIGTVRKVFVQGRKKP